MAAVIQRKDYMDGKVTHDAYYSQFIDQALRDLVVKTFGLDKLKDAFKKDDSFNTIPLQRWDMLATLLYTTVRKARFKESGDFLILAGAVCILKCAAKLEVLKSQGESEDK